MYILYEAGVIDKDHPLRQVRFTARIGLRPASYKAKIIYWLKDFIRASITSTKEYLIHSHRGRLYPHQRELLIVRGRGSLQQLLCIHHHRASLKPRFSILRLMMMIGLSPERGIFRDGIRWAVERQWRSFCTRQTIDTCQRNTEGQTYIPSNTTKSFSLFMSSLVHPSDSSMTRYIHRIMMQV